MSPVDWGVVEDTVAAAHIHLKPKVTALLKANLGQTQLSPELHQDLMIDLETIA